MIENSVEYRFFNDIAYHTSHLTIEIRKHKMDQIHNKIRSIDLPSLKSLTLKSSTTITRSGRSFSSIILLMSTNLTEMFLDLKCDEVPVLLGGILKKFKNLRILQYHCLKLGQSDFESLDKLQLVWLSINVQSGIIPKSTLKHLVLRSPLLRCLHVNWINFDIFDIFDNYNIPLNTLTVGNPHKFRFSQRYINNDLLKDCRWGYKEAKREHYSKCPLLTNLLLDLTNK
ncbi:hypothetical protein BDC45DRAFT_506825 [Circinella umbellata]|nr:hypothetical protein BDC45DRAFT_506825 [Circinella umbellata]